MKTLQKVAFAIALITLFSSCQSNIDEKQILSKQETRTEIMSIIANDSDMMKEMMETMMMTENHGTMMKMMKDNPGMMQSMMSDMLEECKNDSNMMSSMCRTFMGNQPMMDIMQKMKGENMNMNNMKSMNNHTQH